MKEKTMELQVIQNKIYELRRRRVMLDFDLAEMYGVETKILNQSVKRNIERFPDDFMFQLTNQEFTILKSQIVTSSWGGSRKNPNAFTEHGVSMLSGILRSPIAVQVNINIIRAFVSMRQLVLSSSERDIRELQEDMKQVKHYIEDVLIDQNEINEDTRMQLELINKSLAELQVGHKALNKPRAIITGFKPCY